jgi:DeoR family glycerol-3-phosphate regulon repressor
MAATQRQMEILEVLRMIGSCRINDLAERLSVSEETIRRNVKTLADDGLVRKVHGGVHLPDAIHEASFHQRMIVNQTQKQKIARQVAKLVKNGDSLILDIGSTTAYVAQALKSHSDLFIVTNSIAVAQRLATRNNNRLFMAGGELRPHDAGAFGIEAVNFVRQFNVQHAILSAVALSAENGFMLADLREAEFSREIMKCAQSTIIASDSTKFNKRAPVKLCDVNDINHLVCDAKPPAALEKRLLIAEVNVHIAT